MFQRIRYWLKRITAIKVYNEDELRNEINRVGRRKRAIAILGNITITKALYLPANIYFLGRLEIARDGIHLFKISKNLGGFALKNK